MSFLDILLPGLLPGLSNLAAQAEQRPKQPCRNQLRDQRTRGDKNRDELAAGLSSDSSGENDNREPSDADIETSVIRTK